VAISASLLPPAVNTGLLITLTIYHKTVAILRMEGISFLLAVINILSIYLAGYITFKIKEVARIKVRKAYSVMKQPKKMTTGSTSVRSPICLCMSYTF